MFSQDGVVYALFNHQGGPRGGDGREPDRNRWDFDFGRMDSVSGRLWFKPNATWDLQVSTGHLKDPEALEPGNIQRITVSAGWMINTATTSMRLLSATVSTTRIAARAMPRLPRARVISA